VLIALDPAATGPEVFRTSTPSRSAHHDASPLSGVIGASGLLVQAAYWLGVVV
jgi:hypothetical protein